MATLNYYLSGKVNKAGQREVLARFVNGRINQRTKTNVFVSEDYWNQDHQRNTLPRFRIHTKENDAIIEELTNQNARLEEMARFILQSFNQAGADKVSATDKWLATLIHDYNFPKVEEEQEPEQDVPKSFFDLYRYFIKTRTKISESRRSHFRVVCRALERFAIYNNLDLSFDNFTSDTLRAFDEYLQREHSFYRVEGKNWRDKSVVYLDADFERAYKAVPESRLPAERGGNGIRKVMEELRTFYKWALEEHHAETDPFKDYEIEEVKLGTPYYLTIDERNQLFSYDFSNDKWLATQRDIFVFQCVIGCRVSDLKKFTKTSVVNGAVEYIPRKTKKGTPINVRVPLNSIAREILERYADIPGEKLLPFTYDQQYNEAIKRMCREAGLNRIITILNPTTREEEKHPLWEVASSHIARRTFIGNLYKQVKDPNLIGSLSGHTEGSKAFARYRTIDEGMKIELVGLLENEPKEEGRK